MEGRRMTGKVVVVTLVVAIAAFLFGSHAPLGYVLWPAPVTLASPPTAIQEKLFMVLDALEALAFGLGVAFLLFAWPAVGRVAGSSRGGGLALCLGTAWLPPPPW